MSAATVGTGCRIRKTTEELLLLTPTLAQHTLPWLIDTLSSVDAASDSSQEFFSVLIRLVEGNSNTTLGASMPSTSHLNSLGTGVCHKLSSHPRPSSDMVSIDFSTGVLCGCLKLLKSLIQNGAGAYLLEGVRRLLTTSDEIPWSQMEIPSKRFGWLRAKLSLSQQENEDCTILNLMGTLFDGFLWDGSSSSSTAICCDKKITQVGI